MLGVWVEILGLSGEITFASPFFEKQIKLGGAVFIGGASNAEFNVQFKGTELTRNVAGYLVGRGDGMHAADINSDSALGIVYSWGM